jgi:hypothetical protein
MTLQEYVKAYPKGMLGGDVTPQCIVPRSRWPLIVKWVEGNGVKWNSGAHVRLEHAAKVFERGPFEFFHFGLMPAEGSPSAASLTLQHGSRGGLASLNAVLLVARKSDVGVVNFAMLIPEMDPPDLRSMEF